MVLNETALKDFLVKYGKEKTYGTIKKVKGYQYHYKSGNPDNKLTHGYVMVKTDGAISFIKTDILVRYNTNKDCIQRYSPREYTPTWRDLKINTDGLYNEIFILNESIYDFTYQYRRNHADEIKAYLNKVIDSKYKYIRSYQKEINEAEKIIGELKTDIKTLKNAGMTYGIPEYMENIKIGDLFEARDGFTVKLMSIRNGRPCFHPVKRLEGCTSDYQYTTYPDGRLDIEEDCYLDIIGKIQ